jgi:ferric-dicitrate binding protein FerR (iron transport regulator)
MPSTFAAIDKHTVAALRKGDASALEKILRAEYAALLHVAEKQVGDPGIAALVLQNAIVQVWEERAHLETPEEVEKAIRDAIQGHGLREMRRRAAAQGKGQPAAAGPKNVDDVWTNVVKAMAALESDAAPKHHAADPGRPHQAAPHIVGSAKRSLAGPILGGLGLVAVTAGILWYLNVKGQQTAVTRSFTSPKATIAASAASQRSSVSLSDSSTVKLGAETKVTVPPGFGDADVGRVVKLEGSATFVVTASETSPFDVRAGQLAIVAKGTEFTVRAYANEDAVTVRVKTGQVVITGAASPRTLNAGNAVAIGKDGTITEPSADALDRALGWTDGRFVVANMTLKDLLPELKRWYPLEPSVKDKALLDRRATMNVSLDSTKAAIAALEKTAQVKFTYEGLKAVLVDAGGAARK